MSLLTESNLFKDRIDLEREEETDFFIRDEDSTNEGPPKNFELVRPPDVVGPSFPGSKPVSKKSWVVEPASETTNLTTSATPLTASIPGIAPVIDLIKKHPKTSVGLFLLTAAGIGYSTYKNTK